jgi:hypothetical protein
MEWTAYKIKTYLGRLESWGTGTKNFTDYKRRIF